MAGYVSDGNKTKLNKMNRAAQNVNLGTILQDFVAGSSVSSASLVAYQFRVTELSASATSLLGASGSRTMGGSELDITTGLSGVKGWVVQVSRSGSVGTVGAYAVAGAVAGHIKVNSASSGSLTSSDIITFFAFA